MTLHFFISGMISHADIAILALKYMTAFCALHIRGISSAILEEEYLFFFIEPVLDLVS